MSIKNSHKQQYAGTGKLLECAKPVSLWRRLPCLFTGHDYRLYWSYKQLCYVDCCIKCAKVKH